MRNTQERSIKDKENITDCQITILKKSIEQATKNMGKKKMSSPEIIKIIEIVETFIKKKKLLLYGGTAINNILPKNEQFYDYETTIPDYDFFSTNAMNDAIELCDIYFKNGFTNISSKSGVHVGTFKVYVNYIPIADITQMNKQLFINLTKNAIVKKDFYYVPANFLRMSIYKELSRPEGDISRWEKVFERLLLLNKYYPINSDSNINCNLLLFKDNIKQTEKHLEKHLEKKQLNNQKFDKHNKFNQIFNIILDQDIVFFGGFADMLYLNYLPFFKNKKLITQGKIYTNDVLSIDPKKTIENIKNKLKKENIDININIEKINGVDDVVPLHYRVQFGKFLILNIYQTEDCYSYNLIKFKNKCIKVASIETKLFFYLTFIYLNDKNYDANRILCLSLYIFLIQEHNKLKNKGLLKRFSINCYGHQETLEEILEIKSKKFIELKNNKNSPTYKKWFFQYDPSTKNIESNQDNDDNIDNKQTNKQTSKKQKLLKQKNNKTFKKQNYKNKTSKNKTSKNPLLKFIKLF